MLNKLNKNTTFLIGIISVSLLLFTSLYGGFLIEDYSLTRQFISETFSEETKYGLIFRFFGYLPGGILIILFCINAIKYFPEIKEIKVGFYGVGLLYGLGTILVGIFPCDIGCNRHIDPSISQHIHNYSAILTYLLFPFFMILIGLGFKRPKLKNIISLNVFTYILIVLVLIFIIDPYYSETLARNADTLRYLFIPLYSVLIYLQLKNITYINSFSLISTVFGLICTFLVFVFVSNLESKFIGLFQRFIEWFFVIWVIICSITIKNKELID